MRPEQAVFGVTRSQHGTDVLLGIPTAAWQYMKDGKTHTFDLTKIGVPLRIILCGGPDQASCMEVIDAHNKSVGVTGTQDLREEDFSIKPPEPDGD